jgi:dihydroflavonol-4-reductase
MRVLVTGATGFIGRALSSRLVRDGHDVRVLVRSKRKTGALDGVGDVVVGDITDPAVVDRATRGAEIVFPVAAAFREPHLSDERHREVNVEAVGHVMKAAKRHGVRRVIHCSTVGIHGPVNGPPASEESPIVPIGIYEETKAAGEALALRHGRNGGPAVAVVRPTQVYGPGDTRLLKLFKLANRRHVMLLGPGTAGYHLLYIDDLIDAFLLAAKADSASGEAFIIGGPERPTLNDIIRTLGRILGRKDQKIIHVPAEPAQLLADACERICRPLGVAPPIYRRRIEFFTQNKSYEISKAQRLLGFKPKVRMFDGLQRTAQWYRQHGML